MMDWRGAGAWGLWVAVLMGAAAPAQGQVQIRASLARDTIALSESVEYRVRVSGAGMQEVEDPELELPPGLTLFGRSQSSEVSIVNGSVERMTTFSLIYRPYRTGTIRIGPATMRVGRASYNVPPVTVTVDERAPETAPEPALGGLLPPSFGVEEEAIEEGEIPGESLEPVFVTNRLDKDEVYVGEQVVLSFAFYQSPRAMVLDQPNYSSARTPGFWTQDFNREPEIARELINGEPFTIQRFHYALFPLTAGEKTIAPATLTLTLRNPGSFLARGRTRTLSGDTLRLKVKPLPAAGRPAAFKGAVGRYRLEASVEPRQVERNAPANIVLTVVGEGNVATVPEPRLPKVEGVKAFAPEVRTRAQPRGLTMAGQKDFRYLVIPRAAGELNLGSATIDYFDPVSGQYRTASASLGSLRVGEGGGAEPGGRLVNGVIFEIRRGPLEEQPPFDWTSPIYLALAALPIVSLAVLLLLHGRRSRSRDVPASLPARDLRGPRRKRISAPLPSLARRLDAHSGAEEVGAANEELLTYLERRYGVDLRGRSLSEREHALTGAGAPAEVVERLEAVLMAFEAVRFAPPGTRPAALEEAILSLRSFEELEGARRSRAGSRR
jgi:hypothetical protein